MTSGRLTQTQFAGCGLRVAAVSGTGPIDGEPTRHDRASLRGFDPIEVASGGEFGTQFPGAVGRIGEQRKVHQPDKLMAKKTGQAFRPDLFPSGAAGNRIRRKNHAELQKY